MRAPVWQSLEHQLYRLLSKQKIISKKILLMVSGGCDSTALLLAFKNVSSSLDLRLKALHIHHGQHRNLDFRNRAKDFVTNLCSDLQVEYEVVENKDSTLCSEEQLRDFRKFAVAERQEAYDFVAWGHHQDDLLETRLLRLIRGTGEQGLQAMDVLKEKNLRPWLEVSRRDIEFYLRSQHRDYLLDPSNQDQRSWLRQVWLPALEKQFPGSCQSLARSLDNLSKALEQVKSSALSAEFISRQEYMALSVEKQRSLLAEYILSLGIRNFTRGQIEEIQKYLDKNQIIHSFHVGGLFWSINAKQIRAKPSRS